MFRVDDAAYCGTCGDALVRESGFPLGTALIATAYLALVATLAAAHQLRPALLGAAALLAIALARIFAVNAKLRRPIVTKTAAGKENVRVADPTPAPTSTSTSTSTSTATATATATSTATSTTTSNADADADADASS
jgi:hypothetical protein